MAKTKRYLLQGTVNVGDKAEWNFHEIIPFTAKELAKTVQDVVDNNGDASSFVFTVVKYNKPSRT